MDKPLPYFAFISYSHKDEPFAKRLQRYLEHYKLPLAIRREYPELPKTLRPIFRDETDLAIGRLSEMLEQALANSRHLIVICSPHSIQPNNEGKNWIDEEISIFLNKHGQQKGCDRVIPIILRPKNGPGARECLLPTLRKLEILGADVLDKGVERAYNDVIAKMLGLDPDKLWDRHRRSEFWKRVRRRLTAAMAIAGAWWSWSYFVPHVDYYTDYIVRDNIPEGLFELSSSQIAKRHHHYRFTSHKHRLRKVEYCNSAGTPCNHEDAWHLERPAIMELSYEESPKVTASIHRNAQGKELTRRKFSMGSIDFMQELTIRNVKREVKRPAPLVTFSGCGTALGSGYTLDLMDYGQKSDDERTSSIGRFFVDREKDGPHRGIITRELFCEAASRTPTLDAQGLGGRGYRLDALGRVEEVRYLRVNPDDENLVEGMETQRGIGGYRLSYGKDGQIASVTYINKEGQPILNEDLWATLRLHYDQHGNPNRKDYFDTDGKPCLHIHGYASVLCGYNERGFRETDNVLDTQGKPCLDKGGIDHIRFQYNDQGRRVEEAYYDGYDLHLENNGHALIRWTYDDHGNMTSITYHVTPTQLCVHQEFGYAQSRREYDANGRLSKNSWFGADGKPCLLPTHGVAGVQYTYDEHGLKEQESYVDIYGNPCLHTQGYAKKTYLRDKEGNWCGEAFLDANDTLCLNTQGYASRRWEHNQQGNINRITLLDEQGEPCLHKEDGYASTTFEYDSRGYCVRQNFFDTSDQPALYQGCCEHIEMKYDERGHKVEEAYFADAQGTYCILPGKGYARITCRYDERDNKIEEAYYGQDGTTPILSKDGYARITYCYDARGRNTLTACFGADGTPCLHADGYARKECRYNERGNLLETTYYGVDGNLCAPKDGIARQVQTYDAEGRLKETYTYNTEGILMDTLHPQ